MTTQKQPRYKGSSLVTPEGRFSFPSLLTPKLKYKSQTEYEYSTQLLFKKGTDLKEFNAKIDEAIAEVFGNDKSKWPKNISRPLIDQEVLIEKAIEKGYGHDHLEKGAMYMSAKTDAKKSKPVVLDANRNEILDPTEIYGGAQGKLRVNLKVYAMDGVDPVTKKAVKTVYVTPYLQGALKTQDAPAFGSGRISAQDMFEPITFEDQDSILG